MKTAQVIKGIIYFMLLVVMLAAVLLILISPVDFLKANPVYKGF